MNNLKKEAYKLRMTAEEKAAMKARLFSAPAPSPYFFFSFQFMTRAVALLLVVILVGGTGVAYAAQGSLPGSALYPVKVDVEEPAEVALAPTPAAKAQVNVAIAETRLEEAEALAAQGTLDATTTQELAANFDEHAASADSIATQIATTDPATSVDIQTQLSSTLSVHSAILSALGAEASSTIVRDSSDRFAARVLARIRDEQEGAQATSSGVVVAVATAPVRAMSAFAPHPESPEATGVGTTTATTTASGTVIQTSSTSAPESTTTGMSLQEDTQLEAVVSQALADAESAYTQVQSALDATTTAQVEAQFARVSQLQAAGDYEQALGLALRLETILEAQQKYHGNITTPLLNIKVGDPTRTLLR